MKGVLFFYGVALVALVGLGAYVWRKGAVGAGAAAGKAVGDLAGGAVVGLGKTVGIPETNQDACAKAMAEGRVADASFACPAGTFIKWVATGMPGPIATPSADKVKPTPTTRAATSSPGSTFLAGPRPAPSARPRSRAAAARIDRSR